MSLETLQAEIKQVQQQVEQSRTTEAAEKFFERHPRLFAFAQVYLAGRWLMRACLWTLALLLGVVGLKVLWLAVLYMWGLV